jgi:hypothetical protein
MDCTSLPLTRQSTGRSKGARWSVRVTAMLLVACVMCVTQTAKAELGCANGVAADLKNLLDQLDVVPEGGWIKVNVNNFSDVWTPADLRPLYLKSNPSPSKIIFAWSSLAWDCRRGDILLYGGGHANYPGNDTYRWRATTGKWERTSLPSQITQDSLGNYTAVDGVFAAPSAAHTYDNNVYLPVVDRLLVIGGAAFNNGGAYKLQVDATTARPTGPYVFDPSRADGNKVGGTTGSHVQRVAAYPTIVGGMMWQNRDLYQFMTGLPVNFVNGTTAYSNEGGRDVVYISGVSGGTAQKLYRYVIRDPSDALQDSVEIVGTYYEAFSGRGAGSLDPFSKVFVRTAVNTTPWFIFWDLNKAGTSNRNVRFFPTDLTGGFSLTRGFGLDFDLSRRNYVLWAGGSDVWILKAPATLSAQGWTIERAPLATTAVPPPPPPLQDGLEIGGGVLGKWKYIPELDAFVGVEDPNNGNVWIYKPVGWRRPGGPSAPNVTITANPSSIYAGQTSTLTWSVTGAQSCSAEGGWAGVLAFSGTQVVGPLSDATTFGIRCQGAGGEGYSAATVTIQPTPPPTVTISASPASVPAGGSSTLSWNATFATDCMASGGWTGSRPVTGTEGIGPLLQETKYTLQCNGSGGNGSGEVTITLQPATNSLPTVTLRQPLDSTSVVQGSSVTLAADASDADGIVSNVEFFDGSTRIGQVFTSPYNMIWANPGVGTHTITARATDDAGAVGTSAPVTLYVTPISGAPVTVTLQRGATSGITVADAYVDTWHKTTNYGSQVDLPDQYAYYTVMFRFAIFQSEGGPVPDGAQVQSAMLSLYKPTNYDMVYGLHRLLANWTENGVTWNLTGAGSAWNQAGANSPDVDYVSVADATASIGFSPGWMNFDVTSSVKRFALAPASTNFGWRLKAASGYISGLKRFYSSESVISTDLRPKLVVTYQ